MAGLERLTNDKVEVRRMYVAEEFRRRGIGAMLLGHLESWAKAFGYRQIVLSTSELQPQAKNLYESRGYELAREEVAQSQTNRTVGGGIRRFYFEKWL